ncbi:MAG: hypothetical protein LUG98_03065 [Tannerellaceae bacterium]|nr:hypothetical protein [Tannerellaceae bacterium]
MIRLYAILLLVAGGCFLSCSDDVAEQPVGEENEIRVGGLVTRADGEVYPDLHFTAFVAGDPTEPYITETPITIPAGLYETIPNNVHFTDGTPYYPLGENEISLYAYTGTLRNNEYVYLTSGRTINQDAILSNQGYRYQVATISPEGEGTPGSSVAPAEILQFRHLMTQLNVIIKVDSTETPYVDPPPKSLRFQMGTDIRLNGLYNIREQAPDPANETDAYVAESLSGSYTIQEGINYVVPNGLDLRTLEFTELIIDDYRATAEDLAVLQLTNVDGTSASALLLSGYAYEITFLIRRLQVQAIRISKINWVATEVTNEDIGYDPYVLNLNLGDYEVRDESDDIQKVVLFTSDGFEYVGALDEEDGEIHFVTLPADGMVDSVALYTSLGMLVAAAPEAYTVTGTAPAELTLALSAGGMKLENPALPPGEDNPYLISTPVQVFNIAKDLTGSYKQANDIDVNRLSYTDDEPLVPLETFSGVFDGNGYRIQNLVMSGAGLLKRNEGILRDLFISSGRIDAAGEGTAGAFCAVNAGTIVACVNEARIINATDTVGGICGRNEAGASVIACVNTGNIENGVMLGGICGYNEDPDAYTFVSCINIGLLTKTGTQLGGILGGSVVSPEVVIRNSFWLVGTAAEVIGGPEYPVGGFIDIGLDEVSALSPEKLRNDLSAMERETGAETTVNLLNMALEDTEWGTDYIYVLDQMTTGSVWPIPVKRTTP